MPTIQRFAKTQRAWETLARPDLVGRREHTLLLMANGRRSVHELSALMDSDIAELAENLIAQGYLTVSVVKTLGDRDEDAASDA